MTPSQRKVAATHGVEDAAWLTSALCPACPRGGFWSFHTQRTKSTSIPPSIPPQDALPRIC